MSEVAYDTETCLIRAGLQQPPAVCLSLACPDRVELYATQDIDPVAKEILSGLVWGHNLAYDHAALFTWHDCIDELMLNLEEGRSYCTWVAERIIEISQGESRKKLSLEVLCSKYGIPSPPKDDGTRLSYGALYEKPLSAYTYAQKKYAKDDAICTWKIRERQLRYLKHRRFTLEDVANLTRRQFLAQITRNYGLRTDSSKIDALERACVEELARMEANAKLPFALNDDEAERIDELKKQIDELEPRQFKTPTAYERKMNSLLRELDAYCLVRHCGTQNKVRLQSLVTRAYEGAPPMTEKPKDWEKKRKESREKQLEIIRTGDEKAKRRAQGVLKRQKPWQPQVSTSSETLEESGDPDLKTFAIYGEWKAVYNKDLPLLLSGVKVPITTRYGMADSTRTTQSAPNLQNIRRAEGIREAFVPRPGCCFINCDHSSLEMVTVAQICVDRLKHWHLADLLNSTDYLGTGVAGDAHCLVAAEIVGKPYKEVKLAYDATGAYKDERQSGKVANYGKFGGMQNPHTFQRYAKTSYGVIISDPVKVLGAWDRAMPSGVLFLQYVGNLPQEKPRLYNVQIPGTNIIRRHTPFCAAANTHFQGLGAQVETLVWWALFRAIQNPKNPLHGCRIVNFIHDEFMLECPVGGQTEAAFELQRIMREAPRPLLPDIKIDAEFSCSSHWSKDAKAVFDPEGNLLIWDGKAKGGSWALDAEGERVFVKA